MRRSLTILAVCGALAACTATPTRSDFLGDLGAFTHAPTGRDTVYWIKPGLSREQVRSYNAVIIEPVGLFVHPDSEHKGLRADEAVALGEYFRDALVNSLKDEYRVVDRTAPRVLRIRPAITGVKRDKPISPLEFTPIGLALKGVQAVTGMPSVREMIEGPSPFNEATVEMEFVDASTNERLVAFRDTREAKNASGGKRAATWSEVRSVLEDWARDVRRVLDDPRRPARS